MLLTGVALVGGAVVASSVKLYQGNKSKRRPPWLVANNGTTKKQRKKYIPIEKPNSQSIDFTAKTSEIEKIENDVAEKEANRYLGISLTCLGLNTAGIYYPLLSLVSVPALAYLYTFFLKTTYSMIKKERRIGIGLIDILFFTGTLATGHYFAASVLCSLFYTSRKLLVKTEDHSRKSLIELFGEEARFVLRCLKMPSRGHFSCP